MSGKFRTGKRMSSQVRPVQVISNHRPVRSGQVSSDQVRLDQIMTKLGCVR